MASPGRQREQHLAAVVAVQQKLLERTSGRDFEAVLPLLGEAARADRAYYADVSHNGAGKAWCRIAAEWCAPGIPDDLRRPELNDIPLEEEIPDHYAAFCRNEAVGGTAGEMPPLTRSLMDLTGVKSILLLPVLVSGRLSGVFGFDNCTDARPWRADEIDLLRAVAGAAAVVQERRQTEEQLRLAHEHLRSHIENSPLAVIGWDEFGHVSFWSARAEELFGWKAAEVLGKTWREWRFVHEDDQKIVQNLAGRFEAGTIPYSVSINRNYTKTRELLYCEWYNSAVRDAAGRAVSTLSLVLDVTGRHSAEDQIRRAQQQLAQAEKMAALGQMASGVAHDFNNALTAVIGMAELLLMRHELTEAVATTVRDIRTAGLDAAATVRRMQEFVRTRGADGDRRPVELNPLLDQVAALTRHRWADQAVRRGARIRLLTEPGTLTHVAANPAELRELLINLVFNAVDAMPAGGTLTLAAGAENGRAFLAVRDTGTGMDDDTRRRCFDPYFTTKGVEGTGLGLAVSWSIAQRLGGELTVSSKSGRGSTFTLWIPAVSPSAKPSLAPCVLPASTRRRVLLIDDQPDVIATLGGLLNHLGHEVTTASGGAAGLTLLKNGRFDLVITDLGMPGTDGRVVAVQAKQLAPKIPVVLLTGWGDEMLAAGEKPPGVDRVVAKPVTLDQLRELLAAV